MILALVIAVGGYIYISAVGKEYTFVTKEVNTASGITEVTVAEDSIGMVEILDWNVTDKDFTVHMRSVRPGRVYVEYDHNGDIGLFILYVHNNGVITKGKYFGDCTGSFEVIACILIYIAFLVCVFIGKYKRLVAKSLYSYDNVLYFGLIVFTAYLMIPLIKSLFYRDGIGGAFYQATASTQSFVLFTFPVIIVTMIAVTVSNIQLMRKEGRTWRNLLAVILSLMLGTGALLPFIIGTFLQTTTIIDVHYERGIGRFFELFLENGISAIVTYLECILLGTIVTGIKAARHIPAFDKDYIIIHGCQIRKDGTLTKLLQSRADRAIEFAQMQSDNTGKSIVFVPSGGKGSDEVISEGEAIKRYLIEKGIPEDRILKETASTSTEENILFAKDKMKQHFGSDKYKAAFATTNYHVFRTGMLAEQNGLKAEGIGSKTKSYFWINAFVREFIATIYEEKKTHLKVIGILFLINIISVLMMYISEAVLF